MSSCDFADLYRTHHRDVYHYVWCRTKDHTLAEDLTSETFARALRGIDRYVARGRPIGAWLFTIARNLIVDEMRSARRRHQAPMPEVLDEPLVAMPDADPAELVCATDISRSVRGSVARLATEQARCITMRFFHGYSIDETSAAMGRTAGAVKALQSRATRRLRELLTTSSSF